MSSIFRGIFSLKTTSTKKVVSDQDAILKGYLAADPFLSLEKKKNTIPIRRSRVQTIR